MCLANRKSFKMGRWILKMQQNVFCETPFTDKTVGLKQNTGLLHGHDGNL